MPGGTTTTVPSAFYSYVYGLQLTMLAILLNTTEDMLDMPWVPDTCVVQEKGRAKCQIICMLGKGDTNLPHFLSLWFSGTSSTMMSTPVSKGEKLLLESPPE